MITRIELRNFMSHRRTVIEPSPGLTVLIGPNNCGKSALVAALQILCHNENSTYVKRHGEKECAVVVHTSEGHVIEWRRKTSPRYIINGVEHSRLGNSRVPDELQPLLRLPLVADEDDDSFNVHFGSQKSPIFLLNSRAGAAAKFFASSSDAIRLLEMQQRHKEKVTEARRQHQQLEAEAAIVSAELEALEAIVPLADRLDDLEREQQELGRIESEISLLLDAQVELADRLNQIDALAARAEALARLRTPPVLDDPVPLEGSINTLDRVTLSTRELAEEESCLAVLPSPPVLVDDADLDRLVSRLDDSAGRIQRWDGRRQTLDVLTSPPAMEDTIALQALVRQLELAMRQELASDQRSQQLAKLAEPPSCVDTGELDRLTGQIDEQRHVVQRLEQVTRSSSSIAPPPALELEPSLASELERLAAAGERVAELTRTLDQLTSDLREAADLLRKAASTETCPTCGQPFDADRLMELPGGGHVHGAA